ncbi:MAG: choice-of-anchor Q domain-containing protein, partial [bacterium]
GNSASQTGGGVYNGRTLILLNSIVAANTATVDGAGLNNSDTATLTNSTVSGNSASGSGGGLRNYGIATLINCSVSGNFARQNGGGLYNRGTLTVTTSTVSGNSTGRNGGGVQNGVRNIGGTLTLNETLISGNTASSLGPELYRQGGIVNGNRFNLFGHDGSAGVTGFTPGPLDLVPDEALTAILDTALRPNGGPTRTHALVAGSPAIDAGGNCFPTTDQRGIPRPQGADVNGDGRADCDIGAFEVGVPAPPPPPPPPPPRADLTLAKADSPDPVFEGQPLTYTLAVRNNGPNDATGVTVTDSLPGGVVFVSATASQGGCNGTTSITCFLGNLANGAGATVTIVVSPALVGGLSNTANVAGSPSDPNPGNDSATSATTVLPIPPIRADLALTQTDAPDPGAVNEPLAYTLTVTNNGPNNANGVQVTDNLPPSVVLAGPPIPSQGTCSGTGLVVCQLGTLASGVSATVTLNVFPTQAGTVSNAASVVHVEPPDIVQSNNSASNTTTINQVAVLPTPQGNCNRNRSSCAVRLTCTLGASCAGRRVTLFVSARNVRGGEAAAIKATNRIKFATGVANVPPGGTAKVRLRPTSRGKPIIRTSRKKRLRGVMEIRNTAGTVVSSTAIRIRLR